MANGKSAGFTAAVTILVIVLCAACFFAGAAVEYSTGAISGIVSGGGSQQAQKAGDEAAEKPAQGEESGKVLYDGEDMKVTYGSLEDGGPAGMGILSMWVENKTGEEVDVIAEAGTLEVNGVSVDPVGGGKVQAGKKVLAQFTLSFKQAGVSSIDEIESVSMDLQMVVLGESVDVVASAPISMTF